jgi:alkaline phosphatase D
MTEPILPRRAFLSSTLAVGAAAIARRVWTPADGAPALVTSEQLRPQLPSGAQTGDPLPDRAMLWSRADRPARMLVEWSTRADFRNARRVRGPVARPESAFTAHLDLTGLPPGETLHYRLRFESEASPGAFSEPLVGLVRTAPPPNGTPTRGVRLAWSGDMVGQGWGIDASRGGLRIYDALRRAEPDLFVHSGDNIYADGPLVSEVRLDDGTVWRNLVTEAKSKVAETLDEFRGNFAYHLLDPQARAFHAEVPIVAQWDDHEVCNNWYDELVLTDDARFTEKRAHVLAGRAKQALFEFLPIRPNPAERERVYRRFAWGPLVEVFVVDLRSYRGANSTNVQAEPSAATALFGAAQLAWLQQALRTSRATWKVIASDLPIGLVVPDPPRGPQRTYESFANADPGRPLGREHEIATLLRFLKRERIRNVVWITADVHYAAAHHYAPERAAFTDFDAFWEFVAGPMHAGTFGPNDLDATFGPEVRFARPASKPNRPPSDGLQFYGTLDVDPRTRALTAALHDVGGTRLWSTEIAPAER